MSRNRGGRPSSATSGHSRLPLTAGVPGPRGGQGFSHCPSPTPAAPLQLVTSLKASGRAGFQVNEQEGEDKDRFAKTLGSVVGRRLRYDELTGKASPG